MTQTSNRASQAGAAHSTGVDPALAHDSVAHGSVAHDSVANIDVLEREFRTFTMNLTRYKHQVNGNRIDKLALTVLGILTHRGPSRLTTVADCCGFDPSTVSRQVADLEKAGLIEREVDPEDRRAILLKASRAGEQLLKRLERGRRKRIERMLTGWSNDEISTFGTLLGRLNQATERYGEQNTLELEQELNNG